MRKRRKRRSAALLGERALKDIRNLHRDHLRQISAILSNTLGFPVKVSMVPVAEVSESRKKRKGKVARPVAHVAGTGRDPAPDHLPREDGPDLPDDGVGL